MMFMPSTHSCPLIHHVSGIRPGRVGWLFSPMYRHKTRMRPWMPYALDNDAFYSWTNKTPWDVKEWRATLDWAARQSHPPLWALVPDVVADREATLRNWDIFAPEVKKHGFKLAFAVQDGMIPADVPAGAEVIFVGGTTEFKWRTVAMWCWAFKRVHVGRVNQIEKLLLCEELGAESIDGTGWFRDNSRQRLKDLTKWLLK